MSDPAFEELMEEKASPLSTVVVNLHTEAYDVYIGRPGIYGNPFTMSRYGATRDECIANFKNWLEQGIYPRARDIMESIKRGDLDNKRLGCYCKPLACHGDVLRELVLRYRG